MMTNPNKIMLIDAAHPEETRVAIIDEKNRLTDFDFESTTKQTIKGNIFLAKIARVEPSLQAAFVDYGGNRHGFLAFSEIHPDYFRIPVSDREALKEALAEQIASRNENILPEDLKEEKPKETAKKKKTKAKKKEEEVLVEETGGTDLPLPEEEEEEAVAARPPLHRMYKIQEVIQKGQILLVQVVKEERGGKGAALTTYLSLAGRYCVLMPNSPRSGGISRKISNPKDRSRLRSILEELSIPEGMGLIIRTAGRERTKVEIKRDAEFLMRGWNEIRENTLQSIAPALIYEEDDIIKRSIRDYYTKDISDVWVAGEDSYKAARQFMKNLVPSHTKKVQHYKDEKVPLFLKYGIEQQIDAMYTPEVRLQSGGSIVIHPTEALVSVDINSGKSTRERHIEETALRTNLEAAEEIARQVRLRDLAGLIVIDFIDMDNPKHIAQVERKVRDCFRNDRARVQISRISPFGLLELSRQRLRPNILETTARPCPHCHATGFIRSKESMALMILRLIEEEGLKNLYEELLVIVPMEVAFYLLNAKRNHLRLIEERHRFRVQITGNNDMFTPHYAIEGQKARGQTGEPAVIIPIEPSEKVETSESRQNQGRSEDGRKASGRRDRRRGRHQRQKREGTAQTEGQVKPASPGGAEIKKPDTLKSSQNEEKKQVVAQRPSVDDVQPAQDKRKMKRQGRRTQKKRPGSEKDSDKSEAAAVASASALIVKPELLPEKNKAANALVSLETPPQKNEASKDASEPRKRKGKKSWWKKILE